MYLTMFPTNELTIHWDFDSAVRHRLKTNVVYALRKVSENYITPIILALQSMFLLAICYRAASDRPWTQILIISEGKTVGKQSRW